jgi:hypothetical protein
MTQYPKLRAVHAFHDRHCAMLSGDEPDHYRTYGVIPALAQPESGPVASPIAAG